MQLQGGTSTAELRWFEGPGTPDGAVWWWAVEHLGHPAFYLRALVPGDFAPGRGPAPRHVCALDGTRAEAGLVSCGTCGQVPKAEDLEPFERSTAEGGHLAPFRLPARHPLRIPWPRPTHPASCWECSNPRERVSEEAQVPGLAAKVVTCRHCKRHLEARAARAAEREHAKGRPPHGGE